MSTSISRMDLDEVEVSVDSGEAALRVVAWLTSQREDLEAQWSTAIKLAQANGASLRDIAAVAGVAHQTVANICRD